MQRKEIERVANGVLERYNITKSPCASLQRICAKEKITIKRTDFSQQMDGAFSLIDGRMYLFYNVSMPKGRQNFTKGHELGHYYLGHPLENGAIFCSTKDVIDNGEHSRSPIETEANYFATFLLMPKQMVKDFPRHYHKSYLA